MVRLYVDLDDESELLYLFYKYVADRCEPEASARLEKLLTIIEQLAVNKEKVRRLKRKVWRQFREDEIWCQISRRHR